MCMAENLSFCHTLTKIICDLLIVSLTSSHKQTIIKEQTFGRKSSMEAGYE